MTNSDALRDALSRVASEVITTNRDKETKHVHITIRIDELLLAIGGTITQHNPGHDCDPDASQ